MKKVTAILLSVLLVMLTACSTETSMLDPYGTNASAGKVTDDKLDDMTYIIKLNDLGISRERYTDTVMANIMQFTGGNFSYVLDGSDESKEFYDSIKEYSADAIIREVAMMQLIADAGITLTEEDETTLNTTWDEFVTQNGGEETLTAALEQSYTSQHFYENQLLLQEVSLKAFEYYFGENGTMQATDDDLATIAEEDYVLVKHILVDDTSLEGATDADGEPYETALDLASAISDRARDGEDFDALIEEYNIDPGVESSPGGYFFTYGTMVEPFETEAYAMEVGDISDPVPTDYGYHILQKMPITAESITAYEADLQNAWTTTKLTEMLDEKIASFDITYTSQYDSLTLDILVPELVTGAVS